MYTLTISEAEKWVRAKIDELNENESVMAGTDTDSNEFKEVLSRLLPEAINHVHGNAPTQVLDGETLSSSEISNVQVDATSLVMTFNIAKDLLRLIAFSVTNGPLVCQAYPEDSSVGRAQLNPYGMGSASNPRLILRQGKTSARKNEFAYYCASSASDTVTRFEYLPRYAYASGTTSYKVAENVVEEVIERLAGEMLTIYNEGLASYYLGVTKTQENA